ncbi:unnamed protein product [Effrenium voratum]|nr:unnamed protein product [Effrenium voratum]
MALLLKPSEYTGQKGTAVAGRVVILTHQEVKAKASTADAAAPRHGKGSKGKKIADKPSLKLEMHLAGTDSINEVLYVEAWGEQADHLKKKLTQGDLVSIAGATHIPAAQNYSTSRRPYHLRVYRGSQRHCAEAGRFALVECAKLASFGAALQQICVAVLIEENPGTVERDFGWQSAGVQCGRAAGGHARAVCILARASGHAGSQERWRKEEEIKAALRKTEECKMLTEIPTRDWAQCEAVPSTLSALVGAIVPGQLRQMDTVFKVWGLQVMGVSSVRSETDEWCSMLLYHDLLTAVLQNKNQPLPDPLADTTEVRTALRDVLRSAQFCHNVLSARAALLHLWMCSTWTTNWGYFAQGNWMLRRLECSLPATTSSSPTRKLFSKIHSRRVKRSVDCLLAPQRQGEPVRAKLRAAGPASAVNWILRGRPGDVHQVVIMQTETIGEWSALWHVPIAIEAVASFVACWQFILDCQKGQNALLFQAEWTPGKRVRAVRDNMPSAAKKSSAWHSP